MNNGNRIGPEYGPDHEQEAGVGRFEGINVRGEAPGQMPPSAPHETQAPPQPTESWGAGEYDADATAFVQLPAGHLPGADPFGPGAPGGWGDPLAAPGTGQGAYTPPPIEPSAVPGPPTPSATTDPAATGAWSLPFAPAAETADPGQQDDPRGDGSSAAAAMGQGAAAALAGSHDARTRRPLGTGPDEGGDPPAVDRTWAQPLPDDRSQPHGYDFGQQEQHLHGYDYGHQYAPGHAESPAAPYSEARLEEAHARRQIPFDGSAVGPDLAQLPDPTPQYEGLYGAAAGAPPAPPGPETPAEPEPSPQPQPAGHGQDPVAPFPEPPPEGNTSGEPVPGEPVPGEPAPEEAAAGEHALAEPGPAEPASAETGPVGPGSAAEDGPAAAEPAPRPSGASVRSAIPFVPSTPSAAQTAQTGQDGGAEPGAGAQEAGLPPQGEPFVPAAPEQPEPPVRPDEETSGGAPQPEPQPAQEQRTAPEEGPLPADAAPAGEPYAPDVPAVDTEHPHTSYVLHVNGADRQVNDAWIGESLLYVLRERLGLAGAKDGCSQGECGACSVQVDGRLVASCLVPSATAAGSDIRTVEGLAHEGRPSDVQRALTESGAVQCGFCVPGMAMALHDLLEGNHKPSELETRQAICGNLCRCSGYRGVLEAVRTVADERAARAEAEEAGEAGPVEPEDAGPSDGRARIPHQAPPGEGGVHMPGDGA